MTWWLVLGLAWLLGAGWRLWRTRQYVLNGWRVATVVFWPLYGFLVAVTTLGLFIQDWWLAHGR